MKLKALTSAIVLATLPMTGAFAAALDRSGQSISAFLQPGNYFEAGISVLDPNVSGKDKANNPTGNMAGNYYFPTAALKFQVNDHFSVGLLYDQPFGADATYSGRNLFTSNGVQNVLGNTIANNNITGGTSVEVDTQSLSFILGFQPNENWNIYGGPVYQTVKGKVSLRGDIYSAFNGYDMRFKEDGDVGWLAGVAFQIPDIALKASLTYRSEVKHSTSATESIGLADDLGALRDGTLAAIGGPGNISALPPAQQQAIGGLILAANGLQNANAASGETKITTPQSVNLDLQSGIMDNTVAFLNVRWVEWSDFAIRPYKFGKGSEAVSPLVSTPPGYTKGFNLVDYSDDQWSATAGVGRKFSEQWSGNVSVGWDSGAGNPVSTLGPTEGYWNLGLGLQFSPTPATFIAGGVKYFWLGDAKAETGAHSVPGMDASAGKFTDNDAWAYGLKMGYRF